MTAAKTGRPPCGTYSAYQGHRRRGETACDPCREANRVYGAEYRKRNPIVGSVGYSNQQARHRALRKLARAHPVEFRALYEAELGRLQQGDTP